MVAHAGVLQASQEVNNVGEPAVIECDRCEDQYHRLYDDMRFHAGEFFDPEREKSYSQLCDPCHRDLVRE